MLPDETVSPPYAEIIRALAAVQSQPLWDRYHRITTRQPQTLTAAHVWPWTTMEPLIEQAVAGVSMQDAERRVLLLSRPDAPESVATLRSLSGGLQTLLPGEVARAHRHALAALRFVMQGHGAITTVNGIPCPMEEGDLVLTPAWSWHEHTHPGSGRMVWFDGLDLPLAHHLDAMFFELAAPGLALREPAPTRPAMAPFDGALLTPDAATRERCFRYASGRTQAAISAAPARSDGSRWLRYVDAQGTGPVLPTLDCYLAGLQAGQSTRSARSTSSAICVVAEGQGSSTIGGVQIAWQRNDVFTIPHWQWCSHEAQTGDARLFFMTDREFLAGMGYLQEEEAAP